MITKKRIQPFPNAWQSVLENNFLENYLIEWSNKPTNIYDYRTTEYKISKIANYPGAVSEKKIKYGT